MDIRCLFTGKRRLGYSAWHDGSNKTALLLTLSTALGGPRNSGVGIRPDPCRLCPLRLAQHGYLAPAAGRRLVGAVADQLPGHAVDVHATHRSGGGPSHRQAGVAPDPGTALSRARPFH